MMVQAQPFSRLTAAQALPRLERPAPGLPVQPDLFAESSCRGESAAQPSAHDQAALKAVLMEALLDEQPAQRLRHLSSLVPQTAQQAWHLVVHTLLARRLDAAGPQFDVGAPGRGPATNNAHTVAWALQRQWHQRPLAQRWERLLQQLSPAQCRQLLRQARRAARAH